MGRAQAAIICCAPTTLTRHFPLNSYEVPEFQQRVMKVFEELKDDSYWKEINADKTSNQLHDELLGHVHEAIDKVQGDRIDRLW